jgi:hypothetical protein
VVSEAAMAKLYQHIDEELIVDIANDVGGAFWTTPERESSPPELTAEQRTAIKGLVGALPDEWAKRLAELLPGDDDGPEGVPVPA